MPIELVMTPALKQTHHYWGIVLAGGEGKRMQNFLKNELGKESPKQFCSIIGKRSMLRHTIDRASSLIAEKRLLTVICRHHLLHAIDDIYDRNPKTVITVPFNRETAPSILLPLLHILRTDPEAVVAVFPSDHFILEEDLFMDHVCTAFELVSTIPEKIVLLGVQPTSHQPGYGWIEKGRLLAKKGDMSAYSVERFWEKPDEEQSTVLQLQGCLWNTMTLIGRASAILRAYEECTIELYEPFARIKNILGTPYEHEALFDLFQTIPSINFSRSILEKIPNSLSVLPVNNVYWNDWGDEHRVRTDLERFVNHVRPKKHANELFQIGDHRRSIEFEQSMLQKN